MQQSFDGSLDHTTYAIIEFYVSVENMELRINCIILVGQALILSNFLWLPFWICFNFQVAKV